MAFWILKKKLFLVVLVAFNKVFILFHVFISEFHLENVEVFYKGQYPFKKWALFGLWQFYL
jgi:hypothetical protein